MTGTTLTSGKTLTIEWVPKVMIGDYEDRACKNAVSVELTEDENRELTLYAQIRILSEAKGLAPLVYESETTMDDLGAYLQGKFDYSPEHVEGSRKFRAMFTDVVQRVFRSHV